MMKRTHMREAVFMRRRGNGCGFAAIMAGCIIILALVLPCQVWWFLLAAALICFGIWYIRRC